MACERYEARLIEEALAPGSDAELSAHLPGCPDCRSELERQRELESRISGSIAAMVAAQPSPALLARVRQQIDAEESPRRSAWMQWAIGGVAAASLAGFAIWFAGHALSRQSVSGPQPTQTAVGTPSPQVGAPNQSAQSSSIPTNAPSTKSVPVAVEKHTANHSAPVRQRSARLAQVSAAPDVATAATSLSASAPKFNIIIPPGQREAVLRLVAAMQSGRVDVAGLLKEPEQQQMKPLEIAPIKITPLEEKKTTGQTDANHQ
jgi:cytoskeletal protein RodZ